MHSCGKCNRSFGSPHALKQHFNSPAHVVKLSVSQNNEAVRKSSFKEQIARQIQRQEDHIDAFFAQYPGFPYNRDSFPREEMLRMCKFFDWPSRKHCDDHPERDEAWHDFRVAFVLAFNSMFGSDENDANIWGSICRLLGIIPIPESLEDRRQAVVNTHVNLIDMFSLTRAGQRVHVFPTEEELRRYTKETHKYFPKEDAYSGGLLKYLLREINSKYEGRRGKANTTRIGRMHTSKDKKDRFSNTI